MSEFVDFVHQRLEEDEAVARREDDPMTSREDATLTGPFDPARVLREVTAKRTILADRCLYASKHSGRTAWVGLRLAPDSVVLSIR